MFLITQIMDESRHLDVFRKRALANGGGLMQRPDINVTTSGVVGSIDLSRTSPKCPLDFTFRARARC